MSPDSNVAPGFRLRPDIAHNELKYSDVFDGAILASTEVWKTNDGSEVLSQNPTNYYVTGSRFIDLSPSHYGTSHAGFSSEEIFLSAERSVVISLSSEFMGHQNGGFRGAALQPFSVQAGGNGVVVCEAGCDVLSVNLPLTTQVFLKKVDVDFDGTDEVYLTGYTGSSVQLFYNDNGELRQKGLSNFRLQDVGGWFGRVALLRDVNRKCISAVSSSAGFSKGMKTVPISISACSARALP